MNKTIGNILKSVLFINNIKCIFCDCELDIDSRYCACNNCFKLLPFNSGKVCLKCGEPVTSLASYCIKCKQSISRSFNKARAPFLYDDNIKTAILNLKFNNKKFLAEYLSYFIFDEFVKSNFKCDFVVPAPISANRLKHRGYNQAELLCSAFTKNGIDVDVNCVVKILETENQVGLNFAERQTNLTGAFKVTDKNKVKNKSIIVIDDIFTTGSTVSEIAQTLKDAGASEVNVLTLCHEVVKEQNNNTNN